MIQVVETDGNWWSVRINNREISRWGTKDAADTVANRIRSALPLAKEVDVIRKRAWSGVNPDGSALHPTVRQEMRDLLALHDEAEVCPLRDALQRIAHASIQSTNVRDAHEALAWCHAVAKTALASNQEDGE
jgi:hypothetical protein